MQEQLAKSGSKSEQDLRRSSGRRSLRPCAQPSSSPFLLCSIRMYLASYLKVTCLPDPWIQNPRTQIIGMKHFLKTLTYRWIVPHRMPACCLNCTTHTSMTKGVREFCSSGLGHSLLFLSDSCKSSLTECRIVAKFLRSVDSLLTWDISSASHFPCTVEAHCKQHLEPSQHHQWMKMGLLIYPKSHNQNAQRELDKDSGPGCCLLHMVLSGTVWQSAPSLPTLVFY